MFNTINSLLYIDMGVKGVCFYIYKILSQWTLILSDIKMIYIGTIYIEQ